MRCGLLFSGGKDSALAALLLEPFYDVTLVSVHFGVTDAPEHARRAAAAVGFPFEALELDRGVAEDAVERICEDGYPRHGIQRVHEAVLEAVATREFDATDAGGFDAVADGTRRDDRVPTVSRDAARSLEDRHGVPFLAPLAGFGRGAIDRLVAATLEVETGPSEDIGKGDYEAELRALVRERRGTDAVAEFFPEHVQTRVTGRRE